MSWNPFFRTIASETARGHRNAEQFLAGNPTTEEIKVWWAGACTCTAFGSEADRAYDRAVKTILEPHWRVVK